MTSFPLNILVVNCKKIYGVCVFIFCFNFILWQMSEIRFQIVSVSIIIDNQYLINISPYVQCAVIHKQKTIVSYAPNNSDTVHKSLYIISFNSW
jgi:hypothetical protein